VSVHLGILAGLQSEARCLSGSGYTVALSGARLEGARRAAQSLIAGGATHLMSFGLAGGLDPALKPGTLLLPTILMTQAGSIQINAAWHGRALAALAPLAPVTAPMIGTDIAIAFTGWKSRLFGETGASAVDMESHVLAAAASGLPLLILRAVADSADDALPPAALVGIKPDGSTDLLAVLRSVLRQPGQIPALMRLGKAAAKAEATLRAAVRLGGIETS
jgi:adenosylhomocysteine nucleosidase